MRRPGRRTCAATADARGGRGPRWRKPTRHRRQERAQQVAHVVKCGATAQLPGETVRAAPQCCPRKFLGASYTPSGTGSWAATRTTGARGIDGELMHRPIRPI